MQRKIIILIFFSSHFSNLTSLCSNIKSSKWIGQIITISTKMPNKLASSKSFPSKIPTLLSQSQTLNPQPMISSIPKVRSFLSTHLLPPPLSLPKPSLLPVPTRISPQTPLFVRPKPRKSVAFAGLGGDGRECVGSIHVITGPMFAGKTTALLRRVEDERSKGSNVMMIKSKKDNRYALDYVVTHDGAKMPCWALSELSTFREVVGAEAYEKLDVIGIDEAQFFGDLYDFCRHSADYDGKSIIVAGLDGDYLRRSFGSVIDIIPLADSVTKLTARCEVCGNHALFTLRKTEQTKKELIGGADVYMPVCRQHYISGQVVINAARNVLDQKPQAESQTEVVSLQ